MTALDHYLDSVAEDTGTRPATVWAICPSCQGEGVLRGWPGSYTEADRSEWSDDDVQSYLDCRRPCIDCDSTGKVRVLPDDSPYAEGWAEWQAEEAADRYLRWAESGYSNL